MSKQKPFKVGKLTVRCMAGPKGNLWRWRVEWYPPGSSGSPSTRSIGWLSSEDAMLEASRMIITGVHRAKPVKGQPITVSDLLDCWMEYQQKRPRSQCASGSVATRGQSAKRIKRSELGPMPVTALTDVCLVDNFVDNCMLKGLSPNTISYDYGIIKQAIAWAYPRKKIRFSVVDFPKVKLPTRPSPGNSSAYTYSHRTPTNEECELVYQSIGSQSSVERDCVRRNDIQLAFLTAWSTGARISAVMDLRWQNIDLDGGWVEFTKTKTRKTRKVSLSDRLCKSLMEFRSPQTGGCDRVFNVGNYPDHVDGHPGRRQAVSRQVRKACKDLGIKPFSPHGLRRLAADTMARSGVDVATAAQILGHSVEMMLKIYRTVNEAEIESAMRKAQLGVSPGYQQSLELELVG